MKPDPLAVEAWANEVHRVAGKRLHPYCLWDVWALYSIEHPLVAGGVMDMTDVFNAWLIFTSRPRPYEFPDLSRGLKLKHLWFRAFRGSLLELTNQLRRYICDYWNAANYDQVMADVRKAASKPLGAPWPLSYVALLHRHTQYSNEEIWTMPMGQVTWWVNINTEALTEARIASPQERATMRRSKERVQERRRQRRSS